MNGDIANCELHGPESPEAEGWRVIGTEAGTGRTRAARTARPGRKAAAFGFAPLLRLRSAVAAALVLVVLPAASWAAGRGEVTARSANLRAGCSLDAAVLGSLIRGAEVEILGTLGEWHRVRLEDGREGCMHESVLAVAEASAPRVSAAERLGADLTDPDSAELASEIDELEDRLAATVDADEAADLRDEIADLESDLRERQNELADERAAAAAAAAAEAAEAQAAARERESRSSRRTSSGERRVTGFLDLSYGIAQAAEDEYTWRTFFEPNAGGGITDDRITYGLPDGDVISLGGGVLFGKIGVGLRLTQQTHEDSAVMSLFSSFAGPPFVVEDAARTVDKLEREEQSAHMSFVFAPVLGQSFVLRMFVGPSYFDLTQEVIEEIYGEDPGFVIVGVDIGQVSESGLGGHIGVDGSWYWGRFGLGLGVLHTRGEVDFNDPWCAGYGHPDSSLCENTVDLGGTQASAGFRVRF